MKFKLFLIICLIHVSLSKAQDSLKLVDAIEIAIKNHPDVKASGLQLSIASNLNHPGVAGLLPSVTLNAGITPSVTNINQKFTNGTTIERSGVLSNSINSSIVVAYNLYNGGRGQAMKNSLNHSEGASNAMLKMSIQNIARAVIEAYANTVRQTEYLEVLNRVLELNEERLKLVQAKMQSGLANMNDLYLAQLDLESVKQSVINQETQIKNCYISLNTLMYESIDKSYSLSASELGVQNLVKSQLDSSIKNYPDYIRVSEQMLMAAENERIVRASMYPLIRLQAAYNYNFSQSQAGFSLFNQSTGPQVGLNLSMPLYQGGINKIQTENSKLQSQITGLEKEKMMFELKANVSRSWNNYEALSNMLTSDSVSLDIASSYLNLMNESYKLGERTILDLKEAQRSFEETSYRMINNRYLLKLEETSIYLLCGRLVQ